VARQADGRWLKPETFLKNEATDLFENKGSALVEIRNEATVRTPSVFVEALLARHLSSSSTDEDAGAKKAKMPG